LKMLLREGKITEDIYNNMLGWENSGFNVYCGLAIFPDEEESLERLAQYIVRAPISQARMKYIPYDETLDGISKVLYTSKDGRNTETMEALDWMAKVVTHVPNKGEQLVRYYGFYSNKARGIRSKKEDVDVKTSSSKVKRKAFSRNWARLVQKIYDVDPLKCQKCGGKMRIVEFIEDENLIRKILMHLQLWETDRAPPKKMIMKIQKRKIGYYEEVQEFPDYTMGDYEYEEILQ